MNLLTPDTTPGSGDWPAPDQPVDDYREWLREQYAGGGELRQRMVAAANWMRNEQEFAPTGPHADTLTGAVQAIADRMDAQAKGQQEMGL